MPITDSDDHRKIQIIMAAKGCVSGTLSEWPHLKSAFRIHGYHMNTTIDASAMRQVARAICIEQKWRY